MNFKRLINNIKYILQGLYAKYYWQEHSQIIEHNNLVMQRVVAGQGLTFMEEYKPLTFRPPTVERHVRHIRQGWVILVEGLSATVQDVTFTGGKVFIACFFNLRNEQEELVPVIVRQSANSTVLVVNTWDLPAQGK